MSGPSWHSKCCTFFNFPTSAISQSKPRFSWRMATQWWQIVEMGCLVHYHNSIIQFCKVVFDAPCLTYPWVVPWGMPLHAWRWYYTVQQKKNTLVWAEKHFNVCSIRRLWRAWIGSAVKSKTNLHLSKILNPKNTFVLHFHLLVKMRKLDYASC